MGEICKMKLFLSSFKKILKIGKCVNQILFLELNMPWAKICREPLKYSVKETNCNVNSTQIFLQRNDYDLIILWPFDNFFRNIIYASRARPYNSNGLQEKNLRGNIKNWAPATQKCFRNFWLLLLHSGTCLRFFEIGTLWRVLH